MKARYHINVFYNEEDKCYIADIPDLKYCSAHGDTPEEALRESMREARMHIPKAKYRPAVYELV